MAHDTALGFDADDVDRIRDAVEFIEKTSRYARRPAGVVNPVALWFAVRLHRIKETDHATDQRPNRLQLSTSQMRRKNGNSVAL